MVDLTGDTTDVLSTATSCGFNMLTNNLGSSRLVGDSDPGAVVLEPVDIKVGGHPVENGYSPGGATLSGLELLIVAQRLRDIVRTSALFKLA